MQTSHFEIPSAGGKPSVMSIDYQYHADGRIRYSHNLLDPRFDRSYTYDHAARMITALSGAEARGEPATTDRPYNESFAYDAFNHFTSRETESWSNTHGFGSNDSYSNNRRINWTYDSQGNLTNNIKRQYTYDAASQTIAISSSSGSFSQVFDGDGDRIKSTEFGVATYYLRSTVLDQVVNELSGTGASLRGFVYASGKVLAESGLIVHDEVSGTSVRKTSAQSGYTVLFDELDPLGTDAYTEDPYLDDPEYGGRGEGGPVYPGYGNISDPSRGCTSNGVFSVCSPDMSFWGSRIADLPGFGTNWGSFSELGEWEYKQRLTYTLARLNGIQRRREGSPRGTDTTPQSSRPVPLQTADELRAEFKKLLENPKCKSFVDKVITAAESHVDPSLRLGLGFEDLFENISGQGGYVLVDGLNLDGYAVSGLTDRSTTSIAQGNAQAMIRTRSYFTSDPVKVQARNFAAQRRNYLGSAFHETFHHIGRTSSAYSDESLGTAAFAITGDRQLLPTDHDPLKWSSYWDNQLMKHCMPDLIRAGNVTN